MRTGRTLFVRRTVSNNRLATNQRRTLCLGPSGIDRRSHCAAVVAIDIVDDLPAIRLKSFRRVVREPAVRFAIDGNAVVVVQANQLAEFQRTGQRTGLVRNAFHQATVPGEDPGPMINDIETIAIEGRGQHFFRERHSHGIGDALAERTGGRFDAQRRLAFGMAGSVAAKLPEISQFVDRQRLPGQVQQAVQQH